MHIDIDFEVYKALTLLRQTEQDSYSDVLRRLLTTADISVSGDAPDDQSSNKPTSIFSILKTEGAPSGPGAWMGHVFLPNGTKFRATYKGETFRAEIKDEKWIDDGGVPRHSPSEAAGAISGTKVNGWRFWHAMRPFDTGWHRLDELRK